MIRVSNRKGIRAYRYNRPVFVPNVLIREDTQRRNAIADIWVYLEVVLKDGFRSYFAVVPSHDMVELQGICYCPLPNDKLHLAEWKVAVGQLIPEDWRRYSA